MRTPKHYTFAVSSFLFCIIYFQGVSQSKTDSLELVLSKYSSQDTNKIKTLNELSRLYWGNNPGKATGYTNEALDIIKKLEPGAKEPLLSCLKREKSRAYNSLGILNMHKGNFTEAMDFMEKSLAIRMEMNDEKGIASTYNNMGLIYSGQSNYEKALEYQLKSIQIREKLNDKAGLAGNYNNIGLIYKDVGNMDSSLAYHYKGLKITEELGNKKAIADHLNNIGIVYTITKEYDKAYENYLRSLQINLQLESKHGIATSYSNIGTILRYKGLYDSSLIYIRMALSLSKEIEDNILIISLYTRTARVYNDRKEFDSALYFNSISMDLAKKMRSYEDLIESYALQSELLAKKNKYKEALEYYTKYSQLKDSLATNSNFSKIGQVQMKYAFEKKQREQELIARIEKQENAARLEKERLARNFFIGGFALVLVFAFFIYRSLQQNKKARQVIEVQHKEVEKQKEIIEEKQRDILDSINYAKRIQDALLPSKEMKYHLFPEAFILFQPRDIVSGDFYWFTEKNGRKIIAAVDCTGHGVPGAFMSMIGNTFLNEIVNVKGITKPGEILDQLRNEIIRALKQSGGENKDGMDIALLCFDDKTRTVEFAGANNPLWINRKKDLTSGFPPPASLFEMAPNKQPIGVTDKPLPFTTHTIQLNKGDTCYIFTDGFADQFGGSKGKKFRYNQMKEIFLSIQEKSMAEQEKILLEKFKEWKGDLDQVDDVLVIGVRL